MLAQWILWILHWPSWAGCEHECSFALPPRVPTPVFATSCFVRVPKPWGSFLGDPLVPGALIVFEGIDGSGKSSQVERLADTLGQAGHTVIATREPTNGEFGRKIRALSTRDAPLSPQEELDLFERDRREHVEEVIGPALERGEVVISDRYFLSTAAYQGARGLDSMEILRAHEALFPIPDVVFLIEIPPAAALLRIDARGEERNQAYEKEEFLEKVAVLFRSFDRDYLCPIQGEASQEEVHKAVCAQLRSRPGLPSL